MSGETNQMPWDEFAAKLESAGYMGLVVHKCREWAEEACRKHAEEEIRKLWQPLPNSIQPPWEEFSRKLWQKQEIRLKDVIEHMEIACRKYAAQETEDLKRTGQKIAEDRDKLGMERDHLTELSVAAMHIAEEPRDFWEKVNLSCPMIDAVKKLRNDRDNTLHENIRLASEHAQCHGQNSNLFSALTITRANLQAVVYATKGVLELESERLGLEKEYPPGTCNAEDAWKDFGNKQEAAWKLLKAVIKKYESQKANSQQQETGWSQIPSADH